MLILLISQFPCANFLLVLVYAAASARALLAIRARRPQTTSALVVLHDTRARCEASLALPIVIVGGTIAAGAAVVVATATAAAATAAVAAARMARCGAGAAYPLALIAQWQHTLRLRLRFSFDSDSDAGGRVRSPCSKQVSAVGKNDFRKKRVNLKNNLEKPQTIKVNKLYSKCKY